MRLEGEAREKSSVFERSAIVWQDKIIKMSEPPLQPADIGWPTGNGKKLMCSQAQLGQATCLGAA